MSHLSQCAELHDDPDWVLSDDSHQLYDMWVVKLTHRHCRDREWKLVSISASSFFFLSIRDGNLTGFLEELFPDTVRCGVLTCLDGHGEGRVLLEETQIKASDTHWPSKDT